MNTPLPPTPPTNHPIVKMRRKLRMAKDAIARIEDNVTAASTTCTACAYIDDQAYKAISWLAEVRALAVEHGLVVLEAMGGDDDWNPDDVVELAPLGEQPASEGGAA